MTNMNHSFTSRATIAPDVLFRVVGQEAILLNLKTELYLGLDAVGTEMWLTLTKTSSIQDAYNTLLQEYDVEPERLRKDLNDFIDKLLEQSLIEIGAEHMAGAGISQ
jgi:hypothetical protein